MLYRVSLLICALQWLPSTFGEHAEILVRICDKIYLR